MYNNLISHRHFDLAELKDLPIQYEPDCSKAYQMPTGNNFICPDLNSAFRLLEYNDPNKDKFVH